MEYDWSGILQVEFTTLDYHHFINLTRNKDQYIHSFSKYLQGFYSVRHLTKTGYCVIWAVGERDTLVGSEGPVWGSDIWAETWRMKRGQPCKELKKEGSWGRGLWVQRPWGRNRFGKLEEQRGGWHGLSWINKVQNVMGGICSLKPLLCSIPGSVWRKGLLGSWLWHVGRGMRGPEVWHLPCLNLLEALPQELQFRRKRPFTPQLSSLISQTRMWFTFLSHRWPSCALMLCSWSLLSPSPK